MLKAMEESKSKRLNPIITIILISNSIILFSNFSFFSFPIIINVSIYLSCRLHAKSG